MIRTAHRLLALALLALPVSLHAQKAKPAAAPAGIPPGLDQYVDSVMKAFGVPGLSLTIVKDGKVVVAKGYGVRRLGEDTKVDAGTLFGIASNTKVFTSLALGLLVEQGKVDWDARKLNYPRGSRCTIRG
jgi:CubicO group peptidase (beta-lactamase class C family)